MPQGRSPQDRVRHEVREILYASREMMWFLTLRALVAGNDFGDRMNHLFRVAGAKPATPPPSAKHTRRRAINAPMQDRPHQLPRR
jgi:hypothetical protein